MDLASTRRGFLPEEDPVGCFPPDSELSLLDEVGRDLPSLLYKTDFREYVRNLRIPHWSEDPINDETLPLLRLYYVRLGFLASAYVNQVPAPTARQLPANIAVPLAKASRLLRRPPILSYDGYALYNWKRFDRRGPIRLGNIDTLQNFVHLYDEHWFILVHVEIEALGASVLAAIADIRRALESRDTETIDSRLAQIADSVWQQVATLGRIPEQMDPALYYKTFRPYIRFFENVVYEGVDQEPISYRGETGAQSSLMPTLEAFMKIAHRPSILTEHLKDMRRFMPAEHRAVIEEVEAIPDIRSIANPDFYNGILEAMAAFREFHYGLAEEYINKRVDDPRGTGGTPYMRWLKQLIDETRAQML